MQRKKNKLILAEWQISPCDSLISLKHTKVASSWFVPRSCMSVDFEKKSYLSPGKDRNRNKSSLPTLLLQMYVQTWAPQFILSQYTMCKFHDFPITQILCEVNFKDSRSAKCAILTNLEALNFYFYEFLHFLKAAIDQINKIQGPKNGKTAVLELLESQKFDFT